MREHLETALDNVIEYGDTDILPFPVENHIFYDKRAATLDVLEDIHGSFAESLLRMPPLHEWILAAVAYTGFRKGTQIDPIWNVYLLALVTSIGDDIEAARIPTDRNTVFSYRFKPDPETKALFDRDLGWVQFQQMSVELARDHKFLLICDISDFYPRIYHHRLENALQRASQNTEAIGRIMQLLSRLAGNVSYGLPVGGPAARLLSELLLNRVDRLLAAHDVTYCRFVDDYHVFVESREEAYGHLLFLSEKLIENEGLSLQKAKTRILTSAEFLATSEFADREEAEEEAATAARTFLSLHLHYDPYSDTAEEDYEALRDELAKFDVVGMLAREMHKTRVHQALTRKLIGSVKHLDNKVKNAAVTSLLDNLPVLYPVIPSVMLLLKAVIADLEAETRSRVFSILRELIGEKSYIVRVPVNLAFAVRVLAYDGSDESDEVLARLYEESESIMLRRDIVLIMARRNADYWISDRKNNFNNVSLWEKRALLIASYVLGDEGSHWRKSIKDGLSPVDLLVRDWAAEKAGTDGWEIPI